MWRVRDFSREQINLNTNKAYSDGKMNVSEWRRWGCQGLRIVGWRVCGSDRTAKVENTKICCVFVGMDSVLSTKGCILDCCWDLGVPSQITVEGYRLSSRARWASEWLCTSVSLACPVWIELCYCPVQTSATSRRYQSRHRLVYGDLHWNLHSSYPDWFSFFAHWLQAHAMIVSRLR